MTDDKGAARWRIIADLLRSDVVQDHYQPGQALPGEAFLASEYATSRPTIRKAIAQLVGEGLLTVAHGRGTFVRPTPDRRLILMGGSEREDLQAGMGTRHRRQRGRTHRRRCHSQLGTVHDHRGQ
ncbi:GntR family transcriptional regulator [Streptosporangium sp. NPDC002544]|uniref:GntR family transcriptional regulator n=1 Tax=Streptosporangium sp. NPDC002544 TaxID=3154538 RepID=UPI003330A783